MPVKVLPQLRLLNPHLLSFTMKPYPCIKTSPFSRFFPHRLNYLSLSRKPALPSRSRPFSTIVRASKSLIDDEADLSDWVSALRPNSFRTSVYSSDDESKNRGGGGGERDKRRRESDSDGFAPKRQVGRDQKSNTRGGDSGSDDFGQNRRMGRGSRSSSSGFGQSRQMGRDSKSSSSGFGQNRQMGRGSKSSSSDFGQNRQMGRGSRSSSSDFGENRLMGRDSRSNTRGRESGSSDFGQNREMGRGSRSNTRGRERFGGDGLGNGRKVTSFRESKEYGVENREKGGRDSFRPSLGNSRGRERFSNGGSGLKGEGKSLSRGRFASSDDELVDDVEEKEGEKLGKSFSELISEDSEDSEDDDEEEEEEEDDELLGGSETLFPSRKAVSLRVEPGSTGSNESYLSETRFDQCSVSPLSLKAIKDAGYEKMTVVQEATLPLILKGKDVLAKAKTGTGKTVAFLLPSIEVVVKLPPAGRDQKRPPILVLVICPTRELANQAANEANTLLKYHPSIGVQVVIGGTRLALEQKRLQANPCQILVATPGRLKDHVENTAGFATRLMGVKVLVLDEADHLLDMGFRKDIEKIISAVPKQRQTLLFSATVPPEVRQICHIALKRDHEFVDTVGEGTEQTHAQVRQMHLIAPLDKQFSLLYAMLKDHIADDVDYKVLVFCTTAMVTRLVAALLGELNLNVREIHSRKPQSYRTRVSDEFRKSKGLILVTSDVSARGVDYPDVSLVIQVGLPAGKEQYIHRLGRTGRKGKEGQGMLLLAPWEEFFLSSVKDLPISKASLPLVDPDTKKKVERALSQVEMKNKEAAYQAWLGFYNSNKTVARDKCRLVELANEFSRSMGLDNPPAIPKLVLGKMGLKNVPGLRSK